MGSLIEDVQGAVLENKIESNQWYVIASAVVIGAIFYFDVYSLIDLIGSLDSLPLATTVLEFSLTGLLGGIVTHFAYTNTTSSFNVRGSMKSKENALGAILLTSVFIGFVGVFATPWLITFAQYDVLQIGGLVVLLGLGYVHMLVDNWKVENEWPYILSAITYLIAPYI